MSRASSARTNRRSVPREAAVHWWNPAWTSILVLLLVLAALAAALMGVFTVRTVRVEGANLPVNLVRGAAGVNGSNIFSVRADQVIDRLSQFPSITVQRVETSFPDEVIIYAQARMPIAVWHSTSGEYLVDATGILVGPAGPTTRLPVVTGGTSPPGRGQLAAIHYAATVLPPIPNGALTDFTLDPHVGLEVNGHAGWHAVVGAGPPGTLTMRVATLAALLRKLGKRGQQLGYTDLRFKGPYFRLAGS